MTLHGKHPHYAGKVAHSSRHLAQRSREEALRAALVALYGTRFGAVPDSLREALEAIEDEHTLLGLVPRFATGSVEDIAAAVLGASAAGREPAK